MPYQFSCTLTSGHDRVHSKIEVTMLDAVVGAVIMVVATTSLVYSLEVAQRAFSQAGRSP